MPSPLVGLRLQQEGYINQYTAILDAKKIGKGLTVFAQIQLKEHHKNALTTFMDEATKLDEVLECYHMTGKFDFILKIALSDMDEYRDLMMEKLSELPNVGMLQSIFVLGQAKKEPFYKL